jgi:hypothetical protein
VELVRVTTNEVSILLRAEVPDMLELVRDCLASDDIRVDAATDDNGSDCATIEISRAASRYFQSLPFGPEFRCFRLVGGTVYSYGRKACRYYVTSSPELLGTIDLKQRRAIWEVKSYT